MRIVELVVPADAVESASDRLWSAGASAIEERPGDGMVALRTVLAADDEVSRSRLGRLPADWVVEFLEIDDAPVETWREFARPIVVNDELAIRPAWLARTDEPTARAVVDIEPAGSFGLGDHPTTRLSADAVWRTVTAGDRVLDVGCGSGVLSIVAVERGAAAVVAIDVAEAAREATVANARRNGVADRIEAACTPLAEIDGAFDVVIANILAPTLIELSWDLRRVLAPSGRLVISGVLAGHHDHVIEALAPLSVVRRDELEAWACVELVDRATSRSSG